MVWRASPSLAAAELAAIAAQATLPLLLFYLTKLIVDAVAAAAGHPTPEWGAS